MMKNIKCRILIPVIAACLLAGCGSSSESGLHYAIVTGPEGAAGDAAAVSNGITAYCTEHSYTMQTFSAAMDSDDAYAEQFKAAADAGAKYIVAAGSRMEIPVFAAQNAHKKSSFLMVNGEPRKNAESVSNIRGNTECLVPDRKGMGFVAGYVAVKEGYRRIGWLSGRETDSAKEYYEKAIAKGNGYSCNRLGGMYENGQGVAIDRIKALELYRHGYSLADAPCAVSLAKAAGYDRYVQLMAVFTET